MQALSEAVLSVVGLYDQTYSGRVDYFIQKYRRDVLHEHPDVQFRCDCQLHVDALTSAYKGGGAAKINSMDPRPTLYD